MVRIAAAAAAVAVASANLEEEEELDWLLELWMLVMRVLHEAAAAVVDDDERSNALSGLTPKDRRSEFELLTRYDVLKRDALRWALDRAAFAERIMM